MSLNSESDSVKYGNKDLMMRLDFPPFLPAAMSDDDSVSVASSGNTDEMTEEVTFNPRQLR